MRPFGFSGGFINSRMASNTTLNWASYLFSRASSFFARSACDDSSCRKRTNARMISMFTRTARSLFSTLDSMATPCSVKAYGRYRRPPQLEVPILEPQVGEFFRRELEHEVRREPRLVSLHGSIERLSLDAIQLRQVLVQHDLLASNKQNRPLNALGWNESLFVCHRRHFWARFRCLKRSTLDSMATPCSVKA